jgi:polyhydroxyalkanoate synthesis repressor PhaR
MKVQEILIRKYSDRRLYNTVTSRYVKLKDIARMVRDGVDVRVVDGRTGKDLTHIVMTQIIVEKAKERRVVLPLQLLTQIVRASDKATHDFLTWYLNGALDVYEKAQNTLNAGLSKATSAASNPLDFVRNLLPGQAAPPAQETGEIAQLRRQVDELQARLAQRMKPARRKLKQKRRD